jgi:hypothetical protein
MEGGPDYSTVPLALLLISTEWHQQWIIFMDDRPCGVYIDVVLVLGEGK